MFIGEFCNEGSKISELFFAWLKCEITTMDEDICLWPFLVFDKLMVKMSIGNG